jgi:DNA replication ATP-dependent helicase Dna2
MNIEITNECGLLILNPDILVSPTKIAESCQCLRRGVLSDKIKNFGISAPSAILGNVKHYFIEVSELTTFFFFIC